MDLTIKENPGRRLTAGPGVLEIRSNPVARSRTQISVSCAFSVSSFFVLFFFCSFLGFLFSFSRSSVVVSSFSSFVFLSVSRDSENSSDSDDELFHGFS